MEWRNFELIVRAVIRSRASILLCWLKDRRYYFLPGGHVETGEGVRRALERELHEELGLRVKVQEIIGAVENVYRGRFGLHDELNVIATVTLSTPNVSARENHIAFHWVPVRGLSQKRILPRALKRALLTWLRNRKPFFASEIPR